MSPSALRRLVILALCVIAVYVFVYYSNASGGYESLLRAYTDEYPGTVTSTAEETRRNTKQAGCTSTVQKRNRMDEIHPKVLLLYTGNSLRTIEHVKILLESPRINFLYRHSVARPHMLTLSSNGKEVAKFSLIIMTDMVARFSNWT